MTLPKSTPPLPAILTRSIAALERAKEPGKKDPPPPLCQSLLRRRGHFVQCPRSGTLSAGVTRCNPCRKREAVEYAKPHHIPASVMLAREFKATVRHAVARVQRLGLDPAQVASVLQAAIADAEKGRHGK